MPSTTPSNAPIGTVLEAKFRVTREIGRGGMAAVYEAENIDIGKRVAVKILAPELITSKIVRERFIREARAAASIRSPYICDVYDSGMYEDRPFLVMELLEGESLYDMMTRVRRLDVATTLRIANHTTRALAKAHESTVVHRDLKPENIFLTKDEDGELLAKILDFGLAKFYEPIQEGVQSVRLTREGALFGTPAYMSPEQARGQGEVDHRADLWALGCIIYECLIGQTVWNVEQGVAMILAQIAGAPLPRPSKLRSDLPASFDQWFYRALERDPARRFQTAKEMADALEEALSSQNVARPPVSVHNEAEGVSVDELIRVSQSRESSDTPADTSREGAHPPSGSPGAAVTSGPAPSSGGARAISFLLVAGALALGGYAIWLYVLHPPGSLRVVPETAASPQVESSAPRGAPRSKVVSFEDEPYAKKIAEGQGLLASDGQRALELFRDAFQDGSMPAARSFLSHATVAVEEVGGACRVTSLSRPRPFAIEVPASRPSVAQTSKGVVVSWVDNHLDARRRQAFTVLLDSALRRVSASVPVTPEAQNVRQPQLVRAGDQLALVYWDETGDRQGVYVRLLDAQGRISSPVRKLASSPKAHYPSLTPAPNGDFWTVWEEEQDNGATDIMARHLGKELEPKGEPVRLATLRATPGQSRQPRPPDVAVQRGRLLVVYARDAGPQRLEVLLQSVPLDDPSLTKGTRVRDPKAGRSRAGAKGADFLGSVKPISQVVGRNVQPRIACAEDGCFVVWDDEKTGALAALVDGEQGVLWHREFARKGSRPALGRDERGAVVSWYEDARVKLAPLGRDGLGKASTLTRVNGLQPSPDVARGEKAGEWLVGFRDYEAAHFEVFALRAECR